MDQFGFYGIFGKFKFIFYGNLVLPGSLLGVKFAKIYQIMLNSHKSIKFSKNLKYLDALVYFSLLFDNYDE